MVLWSSYTESMHGAALSQISTLSFRSRPRPPRRRDREGSAWAWAHLLGNLAVTVLIALAVVGLLG